jgi:hypothetical protein
LLDEGLALLAARRVSVDQGCFQANQQPGKVEAPNLKLADRGDDAGEDPQLDIGNVIHGSIGGSLATLLSGTRTLLKVAVDTNIS